MTPIFEFIGFFYSPKDDPLDCMGITCGTEQPFPIELARAATEEKAMKRLDEMVLENPSLVKTMMNGLNSVHQMYLALPVDTKYVLSQAEFQKMSYAALTISYLASRGHLKQNEYNGTIRVRGFEDGRVEHVAI